VIITSLNAKEDVRVKQATGYQFELNDEAKKKLLANLTTVKLGDTVTTVKAALGEPTEEANLVGKKGEFKSKVLKYYIARVEVGLVNANDKLIRLSFDKDGHLVNVRRAM
jgi:hypothetical protein